MFGGRTWRCPLAAEASENTVTLRTTLCLDVASVLCTGFLLIPAWGLKFNYSQECFIHPSLENSHLVILRNRHKTVWKGKENTWLKHTESVCRQVVITQGRITRARISWGAITYSLEVGFCFWDQKDKYLKLPGWKEISAETEQYIALPKQATRWLRCLIANGRRVC